MRNYVQSDDILTLTAPYAVSSGGGVLVGTNLFGIAANDIANGENGEVKTRGVFDITALSTDTGSPGEIWYWDNTNKRVTTTSSGNTKIGVGVATKSSGATTARVRLHGWVG